MLLKTISLFISISIAGWQENFRSPASRLTGDFNTSDSRLAGDQKVSCQPAGRRPRLKYMATKLFNSFKIPFVYYGNRKFK